MPRSPARLTWRYFKQTYVRWWTGAYLAVIGAYEVVTKVVPEKVADLPDLTTQALWWLALPLLFMAPFAVFARLWRRIEALEKQLREQLRHNLFSTATAEYDMRFGIGANETRGKRFQLVTEEFEKLEAEILSNNFANAVQLLALKEIMIQTLRDHFAGGYGFEEWHSRLYKAVDTVHRYEREQAERLAIESHDD